MKKSIITLLLIIGIIAYFFINQSNNTIDVELRDFAIEDTSSITKIYLADRRGNEATVERTDKGWMVDGEYAVRKDALKTALSTIKNIAVKHPVSDVMHNRIIKNLATSAVKVEIYTDNPNKAYKTYYVGGENADMIGSFMLIENSSRAFVVYIPGFTGFLAPRYNIDGSTVKTELWRNRSIFSYNKGSVQSVKVIYHEDSTKNYNISKKEQEYIIESKNKVAAMDYILGDAYFDIFKSVNCEGYLNNMSYKDSVINSAPFRSVTVTNTNGDAQTLVAYHKAPEREEYQDSDGQKRKYDVDRMFGKKDNDLVLIQFYTFDKIFLDIDKVSTK